MNALAIHEYGSGKPILVLHGLLSDHRQVLPLLSALEGHTVVMPDLIGCGKSTKIPSTSIVNENVSLLKTLCEERKIDTVIAYSISGLIAIKLKLPHTIFVSAFCNNPLRFGPLRVFEGSEQTLEQYAIKYHDLLGKLLQLLRSQSIPGLNEASMECAIGYLMEARQDHAQLAKLMQHCLVLHGTNDKLIPYNLGVELAKTIGCETVLVPEDHLTILHNRHIHEQIKLFLLQLGS